MRSIPGVGPAVAQVRDLVREVFANERDLQRTVLERETRVDQPV
jgi:hypothetical protein